MDKKKQLRFCLVRRIMFISLWFTGVLAHAGGFTACDAPFTFEGTAANIVPIEYLATASEARGTDENRLIRLQQTAQRLAWIIKVDSWHQPTYGSLGVVAHMFFDRQCAPDEVLDLILRGAGNSPLQEKQILVVLDGRIFIEGDDIFLQSRVRGFRRNNKPFESLLPLSDWSENEHFIVGLGASEAELRAVLPVLDITFPPRLLTYTQLDEINAAFDQASRVFDEPDTAASSQALDFQPDRPAAFSVQLIEGAEWLRISSYIDGPSGYIKTDPKVSEFLHDQLPELDFVNGLLGFLRIQQARDDLGDYVAPPLNTSTLTRTRLSKFIDRSSSEVASKSVALAHILIGILSMQSNENWEDALVHFKAATLAAPYESGFHNLLGMINAHICCNSQPLGDHSDPAKHFTDSLSLNPNNLQALQNLDAFLDYIHAAGADSVPSAQINVSRLTARREVVKQALVSQNR